MAGMDYCTAVCFLCDKKIHVYYGEILRDLIAHLDTEHKSSLLAYLSGTFGYDDEPELEAFFDE